MNLLNVIVIGAFIILLVILIAPSQKTDGYKNLSTYPEDVGVVKPIWSHYSTWRSEKGDNRFSYAQLGRLPFCNDPLSHLPECSWMKNRFPSDTDNLGIPYEMNKI
jgi:hypothetical protein